MQQASRRPTQCHGAAALHCITPTLMVHAACPGQGWWHPGDHTLVWLSPSGQVGLRVQSYVAAGVQYV
jgi:hypothetical protein